MHICGRDHMLIVCFFTYLSLSLLVQDLFKSVKIELTVHQSKYITIGYYSLIIIYVVE